MTDYKPWAPPSPPGGKDIVPWGGWGSSEMNERPISQWMAAVKKHRPSEVRYRCIFDGTYTATLKQLIDHFSTHGQVL